MQNYTIKRVSATDKKKDGSLLITKNGKPYQKVGIQVAEYGETWINGLWFDGLCPWKEGDKVELIIKDEVYNGKTSKVFELPRKENPNQKHFEEIKNTLTKHGLILADILDGVKQIHKATVQPSVSDVSDYPTPESEGIVLGPDFG